MTLRFISSILAGLFLMSSSCHCQDNIANIEIHQIKDGTYIVEGALINSVKEGIWISYSEDGDIESVVTYTKGDLNGEFYSFWDRRILFKHGFYFSGKLHGPFEQYSDNGSIAFKGQYNLGKKYGTWEEFTYKGLLNRIVEYDENEKKKIVKDYCLEPPVPGEIRNCD